MLVVGGGAIGAGVARDAALRGLSVALVEQEDYAHGTTARSTRLIHGGLRYLAQREFGLVRENLRERESLLRIAPHLVFPLPLLVPVYQRSRYQRVRLRAGMLLYDLLSRRKSLPKREWLDRDELLALEPGLARDGLRGAWRFYDAFCPLVERLVVENVIDAREHGAVTANHARAERWLREGARVSGALVRDLLSGATLEVRARETVNATGAWLDLTTAEVRRTRGPLLRLTKGVHLATAPGTRHAYLLFAPRDARPFFVIPWLGSSLLGTTDTDYAGHPDAVGADERDIAYLVAAAKHTFPGAPFDQVRFTYAGLRALVRKTGVPEGKVPREHELVDHARADGVAGIVSILGGKLTGYRAIAEEAVDLVTRRLARKARCETALRPLPGAVPDRDALVARLDAEARSLGLARDQLERLVRIYGARAARLLARVARDRRLAERLAPGSAAARVEAYHAALDEDAATLADLLLRRTALGLEPDRGLGVAAGAADALAQALGWDRARGEAELESYRAAVAAERRALPALVAS